MPTFQINAGHISRPRNIDKGQILTINPASGGLARVEYTLGSISDINNGSAVWSDWPKGKVSTVTMDLFQKDGYVRITAIIGNISYTINEVPSLQSTSIYGPDWGSLIGVGNGVVSPQAIVFKASNDSIRQTAGKTLLTATGGTTQTCNVIAAADQPFYWMRAAIAQMDTANPIRDVQFAFGVTETAADLYRPTKGGVADNTLQPSTVQTGWHLGTADGGQATLSRPPVAAPAGGTKGILRAWSDWYPIQSIPRADGGSLHLGMARAVWPGASNVNLTTASASIVTGWSPASGRIFKGSRQPGVDGVNSPATYTTSGEGSTFGIVAVEFRGANPVMRVGSLLDSMGDGFGLSFPQNSWIFTACDTLAQQGYRVSYCNCSWTGANLTDIYNNAKADVIENNLDVVFVPCGSSNNGTLTPLMVSQNLALLYDFQDFCADLGVTCITVSQVPNNFTDTTTDPLRKSLNASALASSNLSADIAVLLGDGANPERMKTIYSQGDGTPHINQLGQDMLANMVAIPALLQVIAVSGSIFGSKS